MEELEILKQLKSLELLREIKTSLEDNSDLTSEDIKATILQKIKDFNENRETSVTYQIETFEPKIINKTFKQIRPIKLSTNNFKYRKPLTDNYGMTNFVTRKVTVQNRLNSITPRKNSVKILSPKRAA